MKLVKFVVGMPIVLVFIIQVSSAYLHEIISLDVTNVIGQGLFSDLS